MHILARQRRDAVICADILAVSAAFRPNEQPVADLKTRSKDIQKELDEIDGMVGVVSGSRF